MSRSGVGVSDEAVSLFNELKIGSKKGNINYIIYKISDDKTTIVVENSGKADSYDEFIEQFPENDCRYAVYDFEFELPNGEGKRNKMVFYTWSPATSSIKSKMIYASSKDALRLAINGIAVDIQGTDFSEIAHETVLERVSRGAFR